MPQNVEEILFGSPEQAMKVFQAGGANSDLLPGGSLDEEQQKGMWTFTRAYGVMLAAKLPELNSYPMGSPIAQAFQQTLGSVDGRPSLVPGDIQMQVHQNQTSGHYDSMHIPDVITTGASEGTEDPDQYNNNPALFGRRKYDTVKLRSAFGLNTEFVMRALEGQRLESDMNQVLGPRMLQDYEDLAINGDTTLPANSKRNKLLRQNDGWIKQSLAECPQFSANSENIKFEHFVRAAKSQQPEYSGVGGNRWWMNDKLFWDWLVRCSQFGSGASGIAEQALRGQAAAPLGLPVVLVPTIPMDMALPVDNTATPARVRGLVPGPMAFSPTEYKFTLNVNAAGAVTIEFPISSAIGEVNRLLSMEEIALRINKAYVTAHGNAYRDVARVGQHGVLELVSPTNGGASTIAITEPANDCLARLGLTAATTTGEAAGGAGVYSTLNQGTIMWFGPAWNFVWHVTVAPKANPNGIRSFSEFKPGSDKVLTTIYTWQDATIYAPQALQVVKEIKVARADQSIV